VSPPKPPPGLGWSEATGHIRENEQDHISRKGLTRSTISATQLMVHLAGHTMVQHRHARVMKILSMPPHNTPTTSLFRNGLQMRPSTSLSPPLSAPLAPIKVHFYAIHRLQVIFGDTYRLLALARRYFCDQWPRGSRNGKKRPGVEFFRIGYWAWTN